MLPYKAEERGRKSSYTCRKCDADAAYGCKFVPAHCRAHKLPAETYIRKCEQCGRFNALDCKQLCEACNPVDFERA